MWRLESKAVGCEGTREVGAVQCQATGGNFLVLPLEEVVGLVLSSPRACPVLLCAPTIPGGDIYHQRRSPCFATTPRPSPMSIIACNCRLCLRSASLAWFGVD